MHTHLESIYFYSLILTLVPPPIVFEITNDIDVNYLGSVNLPEHQNPEKLKKIVERLYEDALNGDKKAIDIIAERMDGKPVAEVHQEGDANNTSNHWYRYRTGVALRAHIRAVVSFK